MQLEKSEIYAVSDRLVIDAMKDRYSIGAEYANRVMGLAVDLSAELDSFYTGSFISDYGCYPFLIMKEYHYGERNLYSDPVIVNSKFDMESFNEWMDCLSISASIRDMIKNEVCVSYKALQNDSSLDTTYIKVMKHLIQTFNCLRNHYNVSKSVIESIYRFPIGYHCWIELTDVLTSSYLKKKIRMFNRKHGAESGRFLVVRNIPFRADFVNVSCEKYNKK